MNVEDFSKKCEELLEENLVGIYLFGSCGTEEMNPVYSDYDIVIMLKRRDKKTLMKLRRIVNFFKDETGQDNPSPRTIDELKNAQPILKMTLIKHSKAIYGKSISKLIEMPPKTELAENLLRYIQYTPKPFLITSLACFKFWNESRIRQSCYYPIKRAAWIMSAFYFIQTGQYLRLRAQLKGKRNPDLTFVCDILDTYNGASLQEIESALWASLSLLLGVEDKLKSLLSKFSGSPLQR